MNRKQKLIIGGLAAVTAAGYALSFREYPYPGLLLLLLSSIATGLLWAAWTKRRRPLLLILSALIAVEIFLWWYPYMAFNGIIERFFIFLSIPFIEFLFGSRSGGNRKSLSTFIAMLALYILGWVFKTKHWAGAGPILTISIAGMTFNFFAQMLYSFSFFKKNTVLWLMGLVCSFIMGFFYVSWLFKIQHWPGGGEMVSAVENYFPACFLISSVVLLLSVQLTNFTKWLEKERTFLVNNILIPWFVVFIFAGWFFLFRSSFIDIFGQKSIPWGMYYYDLPVQ